MAQDTGLRVGKSRSGGPNYFQGRGAAAPLLPAPMAYNTDLYSWIFLTVCRINLLVEAHDKWLQLLQLSYCSHTEASCNED